MFLLAAGSVYKAGSIGGEASHKLTIDEIPKHSHATKYYTNFDPQSYLNSATYPCRSRPGGSYTNIPMDIDSEISGGGGSHNNMPPYLTVYMWKRIS